MGTEQPGRHLPQPLRHQGGRPGGVRAAVRPRSSWAARWVTIDAPFRVYHNDAESISDHAELLATSGYYTRAMADRNFPDAFANDLTGVYATDPELRRGPDRVDEAVQPLPVRRGRPAAPPRHPHPRRPLRNCPCAHCPCPHSAVRAAPAHTAPANTATAPATTPPAATPTVTPAPVAPTSTPAPTATSPIGQPRIPGAPGGATARTAATRTPATQTARSRDAAIPGATADYGTGTYGDGGYDAAGTGTASYDTASYDTASYDAASYDAFVRRMARQPELRATGSGQVTSAQTMAFVHQASPEAQPHPAQPPTTVPPKTQPPNTQPPNTVPPKTQPPKTQPPNTQPPSTVPPSTVPPKTQPKGAPRGAVPPGRGRPRTPGGACPGADRRTVLYVQELPEAVKAAFFTSARTPIARAELMYKDIASQTGISWKLLAACDWMQCQAQPHLSPVHGERLGTLNPDGTVYQTKSAAPRSVRRRPDRAWPSRCTGSTWAMPQRMSIQATGETCSRRSGGVSCCAGTACRRWSSRTPWRD